MTNQVPYEYPLCRIEPQPLEGVLDDTNLPEDQSVQEARAQEASVHDDQSGGGLLPHARQRQPSISSWQISPCRWRPAGPRPCAWPPRALPAPSPECGSGQVAVGSSPCRGAFPCSTAAPRSTSPARASGPSSCSSIAGHWRGRHSGRRRTRWPTDAVDGHRPHPPRRPPGARRHEPGDPRSPTEQAGSSGHTACAGGSGAPLTPARSGRSLRAGSGGRAG